jgi:photosystem II stability/assembly factor-like uncharacterized protein
MEHTSHSRGVRFLSSLFYFLSIFIFINAVNLQHNPPSGWQQQYIPDLNGRPLKDITFTDSLTGYALIGHDNADSNFIFKTTNSGDNWNVIRIENRRINKISFLNNDTGFACGANPLTAYLIRTTNGGLNWIPLNTSSTGWTITEMFVLNTDTIWTCEDEINFFLRRTTNGGATWANQFEQTSRLKDIYMFNGRIGFMCESSKLFKTTNSGDNWILQTGEKAFGDIYFADSLHGWKRNLADLTNDTMVKTTNGGMNWFSIDVPRSGSIYGGNISGFFGMSYFTNINEDTIWGSGGAIAYSGNVYKGILYKSTNGGQNWLIQIPDTSFRISQYWYNNFTNKNNGWTYRFSRNNGIHTVVGGDSTFVTGTYQIQNSIPDKFILFQNYPNPFNPKTKIQYQLDVSKFVTIKIYNLQGKEIITLVNKKQNNGYHEVEFNSDEARNRNQLSSGIYFYSLYLNGEWADTKKMILLK